VDLIQVTTNGRADGTTVTLNGERVAGIVELTVVVTTQGAGGMTTTREVVLRRQDFTSTHIERHVAFGLGKAKP
jgi:hypothetical protein